MTSENSVVGDEPTVRIAADPAPADRYLDGVRAALADLPASEVAEILDDVRAHLADLTAELDGPGDFETLTGRLGSPDAYADELRSAAGYPAPPGPPEKARSRAAAGRFAVALLVLATLFLLAGGLGEVPSLVLFGILAGLVALPVVLPDGPRVPSAVGLPEVRRFAAARPGADSPWRGVAGFLASLQPAWWVVRGVIASALAVRIFADSQVSVIVLVSLLTVPLSVWVGHLSRRDRRWLWGVVPLNGLAAGLAVAAAMAGSLGAPSSYASYSPPSLPGLWQDSRREIRDIRPVDANGTPLTGVYLFDQDGRPIDTGNASGCEDEGTSASGTTMAAAQSARPYPRGVVEFDDRTGRCRSVPPGPLVVAVPSAAPSVAPTAVPRPGSSSAALPTPAPPR
jgi:hypothetical protein